MSLFKTRNRQVFVQVSDYYAKTETAREKEEHVKDIVPHQFKLLEINTSQTSLQQSAFDSCYVRVFSSQSQLQLHLRVLISPLAR